ncbi:hypothetical protein [Dasania marina]|uniref:hypothetical protein n=1 Tax=Dasania marina TaxID=471499 RepID=UPI000367D898|nr:hypothetical protein [Dasania marina]
MYVFSVNATTPQPFDDFKAGDVVPFMVYLNFKDLSGAELLCKFYVEQAGFEKVAIDKRKMIAEQFLSDPKLIAADPNMKDAMETGYAIQVFSAH